MGLDQKKFWNTWNNDSFAGMRFIPAGLSIMIAGELRDGVSDDELGEFSFFECSSGDLLKKHYKDGKYISLVVADERARLKIEYAKPDDFTVMGRIKVLSAPAEFHIHLAAGLSEAEGVAEGGTLVRSGKDGNEAFGRSGGFDISIIPKTKPDSVLESEGRRVIMTFEGVRGREIEFSAGTSLCPEEGEAGYSGGVPSAIDFTRAANADFDELFEAVRSDAEKGIPLFRTAANESAYERLINLQGWASSYHRNTGLTYSSSARYDDDATAGWARYFADLSFHIMLSALCGEEEDALNTLDFLLKLIDGTVPLEDVGIEEADWSDAIYPPVLAFCLLTAYYYTGNVGLLKKAFPVLTASNRWCPIDEDEINTLQCIDTESLALIAGILGNERVADEMSEKAVLLEGLYNRYVRLNGEREEKTFWDYVWMRRNGKTAEARELADSVASYSRDLVNNRNYLADVIWISEFFSADPWNGVSFGAADGTFFKIRGLTTPLGITSITADEKGTLLKINGFTVFRADFNGRFSKFAMSDKYVSMIVETKRQGVLTIMPPRSEDDGEGKVGHLGLGISISVGAGKYSIESSRNAGEYMLNVVPCR